jgi:topoisomerase IA-like protein
MDALTAQEQEAQNTRMVEGNGTPFLEVEGLVAVQRIRIGHAELPLTETRQYITDNAGNKTTVEEPIVSLQQHPESGKPVLLRNVISNDGKWQAGAKIYITGEWADGDDQKARRAKAGSN